jgi:hypothetical protein
MSERNPESDIELNGVNVDEEHRVAVFLIAIFAAME